MHIGIIGAGNIGSALATKLVALGHDVVIANSRGPETLGEVAARTGARAVTAHNAVKSAALVIVTIPQKSVPQLPADLFRDVPADTVVVDTGNYYPSVRDGAIAELDSGALTESEWTGKHLGRPVFKVFNNIMTPSLASGGLPKGAPNRIALPIAGDEPRGKQLLVDLVDALGFDGIDGGSLAESWRQQPGTPVYCTDLDADRARRALAGADRAAAPVLRDRALQELGALLQTATHAEIIARVRELQHAPR